MDVHERLKSLIASKTMRSCFWGHLFSLVRRKPCNNIPSIMGIALENDGTYSLLYRPELVESTSDNTISTILEHEGLHLINMHIARFIRILAGELDNNKKEEKRMVWNLATDCAVNSQLGLNEKIEISGIETQVLLPKSFNLPNGKASEYYFSELLKSNPMKNNNSNNSVYGIYSDDNSESENSNGNGNDDGDNKNKGSKSIDDHSGWDKNIESNPDLYSLSRKAENNIKDLIKTAVENFDKTKGNLPSSIRELIEECLKPPQVPYYQIIRKVVRASKHSKFTRSFTKINRKRTYLFMLDNSHLPQLSPFPGRTRDFTFNISIMIDTSGSMSKDEILESLSGTKDIIENDRHCEINIVECDAKVQKVYQVKKIKDIQFDICGRGGTELSPGLEKCKEFNSDITLAFTDGYCEDLTRVSRKNLPKRLVWILNNNGTDEYIRKTGMIIRLKK